MSLAAPVFHSWGRHNATPEAVLRPVGQGALRVPVTPYLAHGNGRSYGDSCLTTGTMVDMRGLDRILDFDPATGALKAEAGVMLADVLECVIPHGWFLPVTPGTRFVTLGGALANDVHGKNHHRAGSFGRHVLGFELLRSDGSRLPCSPVQNAEWFAATVGGMGLTGIVPWLEMQLRRVTSPDVVQDTLPLACLGDFFMALDESDARHDYAVAWIDSLATGSALGRGLMLRASHAMEAGMAASGHGRGKPLPFPFDPPFSLINATTLKVFNTVYRWRNLARASGSRVPWQSFFYPLDAVKDWNRAYGPKGLRQFQCVLPRTQAEAAVREMLQVSQRASHASFLTVLKSFGGMAPVGLLSFARPGVTLTLDFPHRGDETDALLARLDAVTLAAGGAVNPYKDARMGQEVFRASFPGWERMVPFLDPMAGSLLSRRVGLTTEP